MTFRLGRQRPTARCPRLSAHNYLLRALPTPPLSTHYSAAATSVLSQVYLNDALGDCVIACVEHIDGVLTANAGKGSLIYADADTTRLYSAIGGYVPGNLATDQGCDEQTALNYWQQNGLLPGGLQRIDGWAAVNGADPIEIRACIWLFENLMFGIELPAAWINPFPSKPGFVWDIAGDPIEGNGHCFCGVDYNAIGVVIDTWGMLGVITYDAIAKYATTAGAGELYTVLSQDAIVTATQKAPNGFAMPQLRADLASIRTA